jgi:hypothetical protein
MAYGLELTSRLTLAKWWEFTPNFNVYNARINSDNLEQNLSTERWSYFAKINNSFKLPKNISIQLSADYQSRMLLPQSSSGGGGGGRGMGMMFGGGGGFGGGQQTTTQGYINPNYGVDIAIRKDFMKNNAASLTLSVNDIFRTKRYSAHSESDLFVQDIFRRRDWQVFRLNFNWRFGKFDVSLFKRKNLRGEQEMMQSGQQMMQ